MHLTWQPSADLTAPPVFTSLLPAEAAELASLAAGRQVLEVGSAYGYSAIVMALAGADVTAVDDHGGGTWLGDTLAAMQANLAAYDVTSRVEIMRGNSQRVLPLLGGEQARFGLIFVDGDHQEAAAEHDIRAALALLEPGGVLAVHDYAEDCCCPGVRPAANRVFPDGPSRVTGTMAVYEQP